jgi:tRNA uridine 5-carbamoylmethylation protein Kti12
MKTLILMRGLPGSGKSTLARKLADSSSPAIFSTDDFFMVDGEYRFNPKKLGAAHAWNLKRTVEALESEVEQVIVDNTNTQAWEMRGYVEAARENGYAVEFRTPTTEWAFDVTECTKRNTHGVPREAIRAMRDRFEHSVTVESILIAKAPWEK